MIECHVEKFRSRRKNKNQLFLTDQQNSETNKKWTCGGLGESQDRNEKKNVERWSGYGQATCLSDLYTFTSIHTYRKIYTMYTYTNMFIVSL